jgi:hypothetical protein
LARIGVTRKQIGWHSFRHSLATNLRSLGVDIKVAQELMRHSSSRTTLDVYTRAVDQQKREASLKVMELMLPLEIKKLQHPSAPSEKPQEKWRCRKFKSRKELLVDLIGIEPMTSSMPYVTSRLSRQNRHTWQHLLPKCCQIHHRAIGLIRGRTARLIV